MRALVVLQLLTTAACAGTVWLNARAYRRWTRQAQAAREAKVMSGILVAALIMRGRAWLECDGCGGTVDLTADRGVAVGMHDGALELMCGSCAPDEDHSVL